MDNVGDIVGLQNLQRAIAADLTSRTMTATAAIGSLCGLLEEPSLSALNQRLTEAYKERLQCLRSRLGRDDVFYVAPDLTVDCQDVLTASCRRACDAIVVLLFRSYDIWELAAAFRSTMAVVCKISDFVERTVDMRPARIDTTLQDIMQILDLHPVSIDERVDTEMFLRELLSEAERLRAVDDFQRCMAATLWATLHRYFRDERILFAVANCELLQKLWAAVDQTKSRAAVPSAVQHLFDRTVLLRPGLKSIADDLRGRNMHNVLLQKTVFAKYCKYSGFEVPTTVCSPAGLVDLIESGGCLVRVESSYEEALVVPCLIYWLASNPM